MPHLSGVFDEFPDLDKVSAEEIFSRINPKSESQFLVNYLGNRILYPQTVALTPAEMELDLAILRAGIKLRPGLFYEPQSNRIIIPARFFDRFPPLELLIKTIIEGLNPKGTHLIYIKSEAEFKQAGSVISPINPQKLSQDTKTVIFRGLAIQKSLPLNDISIIPTPAKQAKVRLEEEEFDIGGGQAGIFIDLRLGGFS